MALPLPPDIISAEPFIPHTLEHLEQVHAFPTPLPEKAYSKMLSDYEAVDDVDISRIVYVSDGLQVTGLMAAPKTLSEKSHPLLVYNRGGNREFGKLTVLSAMRAMLPFARRGYIVLASNYRGNDGSEGREEFGGSDVNDVLNLLATGRQHAGYDGKNAYMTGHSRGGMMTYMALRRGAEVNAAIAIAGISDLKEMVSERPDMEENVFKRFIRVEGAKRTEEYRKRSAVEWVEDIQAPLLLLHGDADESVSVNQSIRVAAALETLDKPYDFHIYPGGNHALLRYWDDVTQRCADWMERYYR